MDAPPAYDGLNCAELLSDDGTLSLPALSPCEFGTRQPALLTASGQFLAMAQMTSSFSTDVAPTEDLSGDAAIMTLQSPDDWLPSYVLTTASHTPHNVVTVALEADVELLLNGEPLLWSGEAIEGTPWMLSHIEVPPGHHTLASQDGAVFGAWLASWDTQRGYVQSLGRRR